MEPFYNLNSPELGKRELFYIHPLWSFLPAIQVLRLFTTFPPFLSHATIEILKISKI